VNVLILTPDAVGSTLLQRLITIYMQFHEYDQPVINLHELTNGLEKYFSPEFNQEIISKRHVNYETKKNWRYYQSLEQIVDMLSSVTHYKTSRLAQYHIRARNDPIQQQIPFYQYLDSNFYVIACRRHNVFDHALSMAINRVTKKLNVYSPDEKIDTFLELYKNRINVDQQSLISILDSYRDYLHWSEDHFNIASYFYYDQHLNNIERFILDLPIFPYSTQKITWQEKFGIDFNDWNRCHHVTSDIGLIAFQGNKKIECFDMSDFDRGYSTDNAVELYQKHALPAWPAIESLDDFHRLEPDIKSQFDRLISSKTGTIMMTEFADHVRVFYEKNKHNYKKAKDMIDQMIELDIMTTPPPIKKQTLAEKRYLVRNFDQCVTTFNDWISKNPNVGEAVDNDRLEAQIAAENKFWALPSDQPATEQYLPLSVVQ